MKKLLIASIASIALMTGGPATVYADEGSSFGSKFTMLKMFAQYHDLSDYQQSLMKEFMKSGKALASEVKKPKADVKAYLESLVEEDNIDVDEVMDSYLQWQEDVNAQFEVTINALANLHASLSAEQRKQIVQSLKEMSKKR